MDMRASIPRDITPIPHLHEALIKIISEGLPLVKHPYAQIARQLNCSESTVIDGIKSIIAGGDLKRFGVIVRHRKLGYRANGMVVWDLPDNRVTEIGHCIGQYSFVGLGVFFLKQEVV